MANDNKISAENRYQTAYILKNQDEHCCIPTIVFFRNGEEVDRQVGLLPKSKLYDRFRESPVLYKYRKMF